MDFDDWLEKSYPVDAETIAKTGTDIELVEHALNKWSCVRWEVLERYNCEASHSSNIISKSDPARRLSISSGSCSLCAKYNTREESSDNCSGCPIVSLTGRRCDEGTSRSRSPWSKWCKNQDPEPMISLLENTLEFVKNEQSANGDN